MLAVFCDHIHPANKAPECLAVLLKSGLASVPDSHLTDTSRERWYEQ